jgi:hypothetical protein
MVAAYDIVGITYAHVGADAAGTASGLMSTHNTTYNHANIANGQTAYGWGNHAIAGYLTAETDPTIYAWAKAAAKPSYTFSEIGFKPTTLAGYGITDAAALTHNHSGVYEPVISKSNGYLTWTGTTWSFISATYLTGNGFVSNDLGANVGGYIQINTTNWGDKAWVSSQGYLTSLSSLDPSKVTQTISYRFVTDAQISVWDSKENILTFNSPLSKIGNVISLPAATSLVSGYLSSTDWSTFNSKSNAAFTGGGAPSAASGYVILTISGTSYRLLYTNTP